MPCNSGEAMHYGGARDGWRCASGEQPPNGGGTGSLWLAVQALLVGLDAGGAMLTWVDRGLPSAAAAGRGLSRGAFGWLGGLENEQAQRPEL